MNTNTDNRITSNSLKVNAELKEDIKKRISVKTFLEKSKNGMYICPYPDCRSGTHENHSGAVKVYEDTNTWHCHKCHRTGDVITLYMQIKGVDFKTALSELSDGKISYMPVKQSSTKDTKRKKEPDFTQFISTASQKFLNSPAQEYINNRGISTEVAQRFKLGYSESIYFNGTKSNALIIPVSKSFYFGRNLNPNAQVPKSPDRFYNAKNSINTIFNKIVLEQQENPVFVHESVIDALSVIEVNANAIALNGVKLDLLTKELESVKHLPTLILCLDSDETGTAKTNELKVKLQKIGTKFIDGRFILNGCKDANEALIKDKTVFAKAVNNAIEQALHAQEPEPQEENNSSDEKKQKKPYFKIESLEDELTKRGIEIKFNQIANSKDIFLNGDKLSKFEANEIPTTLYSALCNKYKAININLVGLYLNTIAKKHIYNPVLDLFNTNQWDGQDHLSKVYDVLGIEQDDILSRTLLLKWFWQGHALIRNSDKRPFGADGVLTLTGNQGLGKTSFFEHMAIEPDFFRGGQRLSSLDKDTERRCVTTWIAELGEIDTTFKFADMGMLKAFITKAFDEYRLPYGREDEQSARRANLAATVNGKKFLIDTTGNRRFWTVPVENIDLDGLKRIDALQVWLQVWEQYAKHNLQGFRLTKEEQEMLALKNKDCEKGIKGEAEVLDILSIAEQAGSGYTMEYITVSQFKQENDILRSYSVEQLGKVLDNLGITREAKRLNGKVQRVRLLPKRTYPNFG